MEVISVNIGDKLTVKWRGKNVETGIFKEPVDSAVFLGKTDVEGDKVIDRKYHGGIDKACYIYSADHYTFWKSLYPNLEWNYGMFGENLTIKGFSEKQIQIGDIFRIGGATVQVSEPRQPCFKLGIRFGDQSVLKHFIENPFPGAYLRVLDPAEVLKGDSMDLIERQHNSLGLLEIWNLLYDKTVDEEKLQVALELPYLAEACKDALRRRQN